MTSISKNVYIDKLDDIGNKCNNTYQRTIKMKPLDVKSMTYIDPSKEINNEYPKFKIGDAVRISNIKIFLQKSMFQFGQKRFLWLKKLKRLWRGHMLLVVLRANKFLENFTEKDWKRQIKKSSELKK